MNDVLHQLFQRSIRKSHKPESGLGLILEKSDHFGVIFGGKTDFWTPKSQKSQKVLKKCVIFLMQEKLSVEVLVAGYEHHAEEGQKYNVMEMS